MRITIAAVGRLKDGAERELCARYIKRFDGVGRGLSLGPLSVSELTESRLQQALQRKDEEAERLLRTTQDADCRVALTETGKSLSSEAFASWIADRRDGGCRSLALIIGGADGLAESLLQTADLKLSLGAMTLPHGLARIVLAEQLYRASTILAGHPYHRA